MPFGAPFCSLDRPHHNELFAAAGAFEASATSYSRKLTLEASLLQLVLVMMVHAHKISMPMY